MCSMNWETYSFIPTRHVPVLGTLWGGWGGCHGFVKPTNFRSKK